jgi:hypothetical protein
MDLRIVSFSGEAWWTGGTMWRLTARCLYCDAELGSDGLSSGGMDEGSEAFGRMSAGLREFWEAEHPCPRIARTVSRAIKQDI